MSTTDLQPWWNVSITCKRGEDDDEREFSVQAPTSAQAVMVALGATEFKQHEPIHSIHVGRPVQRPRNDVGSFGWRDLLGGERG